MRAKLCRNLSNQCNDRTRLFFTHTKSTVPQITQPTNDSALQTVQRLGADDRGPVINDAAVTQQAIEASTSERGLEIIDSC